MGAYLARWLDALLPARVYRRRQDAALAAVQAQVDLLHQATEAHLQRLSATVRNQHDAILLARFRLAALEDVLVQPGSARQRALDVGYAKRVAAAQPKQPAPPASTNGSPVVSSDELVAP